MSLFDTNRPVTQEYIQYLLHRNQLWYDKYIADKPQDYRGDSILEKHLFCNIYRELDAYSKEEIKRMRTKGLRQQVILICFGRLSMSWATNDMVMDEGCSVNTLNELNEYEPLFNDAISIPLAPEMSRGEILRHHYELVLKYADEIARIAKEDHAMSLFRTLQKLFPYIGDFRAYELCTSLSYSEHLELTEEDVCIVGHGAIAGLNYVTGREDTQESGMAILPDLRDEVRNYLQQHTDFHWIPAHLQGNPLLYQEHKFTTRTLEDTCCEFRKYYHARNGMGHKRLYNARN